MLQGSILCYVKNYAGIILCSVRPKYAGGTHFTELWKCYAGGTEFSVMPLQVEIGFLLGYVLCLKG